MFGGDDGLAWTPSPSILSIKSRHLKKVKKVCVGEGYLNRHDLQAMGRTLRDAIARFLCVLGVWC